MQSFISFKNIRGDLFGGLTAGIVAIPLALAFGIQAFSNVDDPAAVMLGALAGITGAMMLGFFASLFGGTPAQVSGPTGPMTVITAGLVGAAYARFGNLESALTVVIISFIICGLFQIIFGLIRLGKYIRYIPYPVLSGFMSGIGLIIILLQIFPLFGMKSPATIIGVFGELPSIINAFSIQALLMGLLTIAIIYLFPLITKKVPSTLVALLAVSVLATFTGFDAGLTIGKIPSGFPAFHYEAFSGLNWEMFTMAIIPGLTLAGLGAIDTLLTSVVADNITGTRHKSNRELIGQGIGNTISGLFGGIPGAGATMRTVVNVKSGGKTKLSGMFHSLLLLGVLLGLGPFVSYIPLSVLAGVLITVGIGIIDFKGLKDLFRIPRADAVVLIIVLLLTVFVDLLQAVGIGMVIASVLFMKRASDLVDSGISSRPIDSFDKEMPWEDEKDLSPELQESIYIQRLDGPIFFGSVNKFQDVMASVPDHSKVVIIRMKKVSFMDQSGLYALESSVRSLKERGKVVLMTIIQPQPLYMMERTHLIPDLIPQHHTFKTFEDCAQWLKKHLTLQTKARQESGF